MVSAIQFAVRDSAGGRQLGTVAGDEQGNFIQVGRGDSISLNVSPASIVAYEQQGRDLVIKLADGRMIVLAGYFDPLGGGETLYLSADGQITEVTLTGSGEGVLAANYGPVQPMEKWSPLDDLRFTESDTVMASNGATDEPAGMGIFAPALLAGGGGLGAGALGLVGLGVLTGGGGGGDTTPGGGGDATVPGGGGGNPTVPGGGGGNPTVPGGGGGDATVPGGGGGNPTVPGGGGGDATVPGGGGGDATVPGGGGGNPTVPGGGGGNPTVPGGGGGDATVPGGGGGNPTVPGGGGGNPTVPGGGGGDGDTTPGGGGRVAPTVDNPNAEFTLTTNTNNPTIVVTGTGQPGDSVVVSVGGSTQTTTITPGGTWGVTLTGPNLPADGSYSASVVVSGPGLAATTLDGPNYIIDMTPPAVSVTEGTQGAGDIENLVDYQNGVTIAGEGEPGAAIVVTVEGISHSTTVNAAGSWTVTFTQAEVAGGERSTPVTVRATDPLGNVTTITDTLVLDTIPNPVNINSTTADNTVSQSEYNAGFAVSGTTAAGAVITLEVGGITRTITAGADGAWSTTFAPGTIAGGTYMATVTASTVDAAGNTSSTTRTFTVDTEVTVAFAPGPIAGDNIVNMAESSAGVVVTGTSQAGSSVMVQWGSANVAATTLADGSWTVTFPRSQVPADGSTTVTATATDSVGNTSSVMRTIAVDTIATAAINPAQVGDDVVSGAERSVGFNLIGTAEAGSSVVVTLEGVTQTVIAGADGMWTAAYAANEIRSGTYASTVSITATDPAGNTATATRGVRVDTETNVAFNAGQVGGDNTISGAERTAGVTLTGTAEAGASVAVTFEGTTHTVTASDTGTWSAAFTAAEIPPGTRSGSAIVVATDAFGNTATSTQAIAVDTEANVAFTAGPVAGDNIVNMIEATGGVVLTGTSEPGSTVSVNWGGFIRPATVGADGGWTVTYPGGNIPADGNTSVTVAATDRFGNTATATRAVVVDTQTAVSVDATQVGDNVVSGAERSAGFTLTGRAEAGATVVVQFEGAPTRTVIAGANGTWVSSYAPGEMRSGMYQAAINVSATDVAGNVAQSGRVIAVDTETNVSFNVGQTGGDNIISGAERLAGITLTGLAEPGASVAVTFEGITHTVIAGTNGAWSAPFATSQVATGTRTGTASVTATDIYGNTATATHTIRTDTEVVPLTRSTLSAGADDVVNQAEAARGLTITGTVEAGSSVTVQFGTGAARIAMVAANGTWTATIPTGDIPMGEASPTMTVTATDAVGNTRVHTETVQVDRVVRNFTPGASPLAGDGILNAEEAAQGLVVNGTAEPGATVVIQIARGGQATVTSGPDGLWTHTFGGASLPRGEMNTSVTVTATDRAGNVASYSQPLIIDTIAPGAPDINGFGRNGLGLTDIRTDDVTERYEFSRIDQNGNVSQVGAVYDRFDRTGEQFVTFGTQSSTGNFTSTPVPDGSYLVVNTTDAAGNESSTLMVVNNTNAPNVDLNRTGLTNFDFSAIDLTFAPDARLTITESQILNLTGADKTIVIKGGEDDRVSIVGGIKTLGTQEIDGETYNIYTVGSSGATVLLDSDITVI